MNLLEVLQITANQLKVGGYFFHTNMTVSFWGHFIIFVTNLKVPFGCMTALSPFCMTPLWLDQFVRWSIEANIETREKSIDDNSSDIASSEWVSNPAVVERDWTSNCHGC